jgi:hypothetical protein
MPMVPPYIITHVAAKSIQSYKCIAIENNKAFVPGPSSSPTVTHILANDSAQGSPITLMWREYCSNQNVLANNTIGRHIKFDAFIMFKLVLQSQKNLCACIYK